MKIMIRALIMSVILSSVVLALTNKPATVPFVDLEQYKGLWYEVASIPMRFQKQCLGGTTAEYSLLEDGLVRVVNSCDTDSERDSVEGRAKVKNSKTQAELKVTFVKLLGWVFAFGGDYWVIGLADDYRYAVVGHPKRTYGWILSRTPSLTSEDLADIQLILSKQGYDLCEFRMTPQNGTKSLVTDRPKLCDMK